MKQAQGSTSKDIRLRRDKRTRARHSKADKRKNLYVKLHDIEKAASIRNEEEKLKKLHDQILKQWKDNLNKEIPVISEDDVTYTSCKDDRHPALKARRKRIGKTPENGRSYP